MHELFAGANKTATDALTGAVVPEAPDPPVLTVPVEFLQLCQSVILHSDADRVQTQHMAQSVQRDMHKMKAFVRFRTVQDEAFKSRPESGPLHVAWFEPDHHIVKAIAPFFARRFTQMRWAILTPECSVDWSGASLHFGPGAVKADAPPADAGEQLWLNYYQTTFNPARLKLKSMQKEMPRRYWKNLPEGQLISGLAAGAADRRAAMIEQPPTMHRRGIPAARPAAAATERRAQRELAEPSRWPYHASDNQIRDPHGQYSP